MSYSGNLPDWHQFNPPQHGRTGTSNSQNVNSSHLFLSGINPLDSINLTTNDRQSKHQRNDVGYGARNYQTSSMSGTTCSTNSSSSVHMGPLTGCVGHYGSSPSRNTMMENLPPAIDPRIPPVGSLNETDLPHRTNQIQFNTPNNHAGGSNMAGIHGNMGPQTSPVGPMSPGRQGPPYGTCKGPCCNPDTNISYPHWEKYGHYPPNPPYRDNMRSASYHAESRRYMPDMNLRKDCIENKDLVSHGFGVENRRNYSDYKYRKELSRNYSTTSGLFQNYPMQNFTFPPDYQKCPYSVKEYRRQSAASSGGTLINHQNTGIMKYPEHSNVNVPQKYNGKQMSYSNGSLPTVMPNTSSSNLPSQNSYFNPQLPRDVPRDFPREYQESTAVNNRLPTSPSSMMHGSYQKYHVYQQKIAMQRFSIENHLRAMSRVPGYQSHPKYQEYLMRYRELLRLQQNVDYQGMLQETSKIPSPLNAPIPPINLQFDQNGVLINSSYNPNHFPGMLNTVNSLGNPENIENPDPNRINRSLESQNQSLNLSRDAESINHANTKSQENYLMQKADGSDFENLIVNVDDLDMSPATAEATMTRAGTSMENVNSKQFADKPDLDVRQFLANWDETEDEEGLATTYSAEAINNNNNNITNNSNDNNGHNINNNNNNNNKNNHCNNNNSNNNDNNNSNIVNNKSATLDITTNSSPEAIVNIDNVNQQNVDKPRENENNSEQSVIVDASLIVQNNVENINVEGLKTIEELANSGTIVQCIQTDTDNIPTIHIVDHLSNDTELATVQTVYGDVTSLTLEQIAKAPIEIINETSQGTETITLFEPDSGVCIKLPECESVDTGFEGQVVVEEVVASIINASVEITESSQSAKEISEDNNENNDESINKNVTYEKSPINSEENQKVSNLSNKENQNVESTNLKKHHSFASEESHNPDDISLPDLPMSECTPISTTLNTPIHSDSEESSEHMADLSISTNPIEIVPNSPIISFTHSPIKIDPYGNLENGNNNRLAEKRPEDSLDFDFHQNDNSKNKFNDDSKKTAVEDFEIARRSTNETTVVRPVDTLSEVQQNEKVPSINPNSMVDKNKLDSNDDEFYPLSDPLVGMNQRSDIVSKENSENSTGIADISNDIMQAGECSVESLGANTIPVSKILSSDEIDTGKCPSIINTEDFQHSDELDKLCNMSLDDACIMPLITGEDSRESRLPTSIEDQAFNKVINNILPISDMNVLQSSDEEPLDKDDDDWIEVKSLPGSPVNPCVNEVINKSTNYSAKLLNQHKHSNDFNKSDSFQDDKKSTKNYNTGVHSPQSSKTEHNLDSDNYLFKANNEKKQKKNYIPSIFDISGESQSTDFDKFERKRQEKQKQDRLKFFNNDKSLNDDIIKYDKLSNKLNKVDKNNEESLSLSFNENSKIYDLMKSEPQSKNLSKKINKDLHNEKSFESISDALKALENYEMCTVSPSYCRTNKNVQIQVANVKETIDDKASEDIDAIEITINVSQSERSHGSIQLRDELTEKVSEVIRKHTFFPLDPEHTTTPRNIFNHRRTSMPDELKKPKKLNEKDRRRNSGGHSFKISRRKSLEERSVDDYKKNQYFNTPSRLSESTISEAIVEKEEINSINFSNKSSYLDQDDSIEPQENISSHNFNDRTDIESVIGFKSKKKNLIRKPSEEETSTDENTLEFCSKKKNCTHRISVDEMKDENISKFENDKKEYECMLPMEEKRNYFKSKIRDLKKLTLEDSLKFRNKKKESRRRISIESMEDNRKLEFKSKKKNSKRRKSTGCTENETILEFHYEKKKKSPRRSSIEGTVNSVCEFDDVNENLTKEISIENELDIQSQNKIKESSRRLSTYSLEDNSMFESQNKKKDRRMSTEKLKSSVDIEDLENLMSKSSCDINLAPSDASLIDNLWNKSNFLVENTSSFNFDTFDVAPNENSFINFTSREDEDGISSRMDEGVRNRRLEDSERYRNPYSSATPIDLDSQEINLDSVPVYTTQDGRITYSLNPKYTYRKLIQESRRKDSNLHSKLLKNYYEKSFRPRFELPEDDKWEDYSPNRTKQYNNNEDYDRWEGEDWQNQSEYNRKFLEYEELTDNQSMNYSDTFAVHCYSPAESTFQYQHRKYSQMMLINKKTDNCYPKSPVKNLTRRKNDAEWNRAINNITNSPINHSEEIEKVAKSLEKRSFNVDDFKSSKNNVESEYEEITGKPVEQVFNSTIEDIVIEETPKLDFNIQEIQKNDIKSVIPEYVDPGLTDEDSKDVSSIAASVTPIKPTISIDIEQDSQAMLTDSGVESSTTYAEGRKGLKRINKEQQRKNAYLETVENITVVDELSKKDNLNEKVDTEIKIDSPEVHPNNNAKILEAVEENHDKGEICDKSKEIVETSREKPKIISNIKLNELFSFKNNVTDFDSSILKGLDLAISHRKVSSKTVPIQINVESADNESEYNDETRQVDDNQKSMSFLGFKKSTEGPIRRVSSDEVEKRKNIFLQDSCNITETWMSTAMSSNVDSLIENVNIRKHNKELTPNKFNNLEKLTVEDKKEGSIINSQSDFHVFEKPEVPPLCFETFTSVTQKSKIESEQVSIESEISQYIDTLSSTQFGSECAEYKSDETSNIGINFLSSSQEAIDATDWKKVRNNLISSEIDNQTESKTNSFKDSNNSIENTSKFENEKQKCNEKILTFSGRISSESEDDSNALDGSPINNKTENIENKIEEKEKILTFSGRIQSPENLSNAQNPTIQTIDKDTEKPLNFSGRIPTPEACTDDYPVKSELKNSVSLNNDDDNCKNLTFSGKIIKEECGSFNKSSVSDKIPKFIIKKTDYSSVSSSISQVLPSDISQTETKASSSNKTSLHPKIPKMIIRNVKSWPETPTAEENAVELSFPKTPDGEDKVFKVKIKLDDLKQHESRKDSIKKSIGVIECKVPKMKIKLEDRQPKMIFENASMELYNNDSTTLKNVPKLKIRKVKRSREEKSSKPVEKSKVDKSDRHSKNRSVERAKSPSGEIKHKDFDHVKQEKILKLKIKKPDTSSSQSESLRKKRSKTPDNLQNHKKSSSKHRDNKTIEEKSPSIDKEENTNSHQSISEKVPKVIIKRTFSSSEYKCELSKDGGDAIKRDSKWQPEVKLERFEVLDSIAKESGQKKFPPKMLEIISKQTKETRASKCSIRGQWTRTSSDPDKMKCRDEKTSNKHKRRHSDGERPRYQMKESTLKILDCDSDSEDFPKVKRRDISRRLNDDSSIDGTCDSKSINFESTNVVSVEEQSCLIQIPMEKVTLEYPTTSSNHTKPSEHKMESINATIETDGISVIKNPDDFEESVIKLESSDDSQTTIEILPASPETSRLESQVPTPLEGKRRIANGDMAQLYSEDAIPTQFELELEIVDHTSESLDGLTNSVNEIDCSTTCLESTISDLRKSPWTYQTENFSDDFNNPPSLASTTNIQQKDEFSDKTLCYSDLLVKEVLAAKETLKRCLAKNKIEPNIPPGFTSRPKTAAEKKQGAGFNLTDTSNKISSKDHRNVFQDNESGSSSRKNSSQHDKNDRKHLKTEKSSSSSEKREKRKNLSDSKRRDESSRDSRNDVSSTHHESVKSLKRSSESSEFNHSSSKRIKSSSASLSSTSNAESFKSKTSAGNIHESIGKTKNTNHPSPSTDSLSKLSSSKKSKASKTQESSTVTSNPVKPVEIMPILEPEAHANYDVNERNTSRSPPVITKQDSREKSPQNLKTNETDEKINLINKESEAITFADIVMQMAYHEKATIKHKRYCPLCERWFPTTERHRRHLDGYQHRHTELTQRRTVHALFMMFTGKPCPRLLPASIVRTDCVPGEPTPLQIAVQDVAISLEKAAKDKKKTVDKEDK